MMKFYKILLSGSLLAMSCTSFSAGTSNSIALSRARINVHDRAAIVRGAHFFAQNCISCHTMRFLTHNQLAIKAGITKDKMPNSNADFWLGSPPPDLSLIARQRGDDWLYTYFHSFYQDKKSATGSNNLLVPNTSMANVFLGLQGEQVRIKPKSVIDRHQMPKHFTQLELISQGSMTPDQFNDLTHDLTAFLVYASDPSVVIRHQLGYWVLGFLLILGILAYFLKKEYWKDIK